MPQAPEIILDDSATSPTHANFRRVTATPEEVILHFGLNSQPFASGTQEIKAAQRIVMNFFTAKRMLMALGLTVQRQEQTFGASELDVSRRVARPASFTRAEPTMPADQPPVVRIEG